MKWEDVDNSYEYALEKIMTLNTAISQAKDVIRIQQEHINRMRKDIESIRELAKEFDNMPICDQVDYWMVARRIYKVLDGDK